MDSSWASGGWGSGSAASPTEGMEGWLRGQPLSVLALHPADRVVLRIAGKTHSQTGSSPTFW